MRIFITQNKKFIKLGILIFWIAVWQVIYMAVGNDILVVSPAMCFSTLIKFFSQGSFWNTVFLSLTRICSGYILALVVGVILAGLACSTNLIYDLLQPIMVIVKATPVASFIILALLWINTDFVPVFIAFLMVMPMIYINVYNGIKQTDKKLLEMAKIFKFGKAKTLRLIYFPSVIPYFIPSATTALGFAWKSGVAAEVICTPKFSIGKAIYESKIYLEIPELFAWTVAVVGLSILIERVFIIIFKKFQNYLVKAGGNI